MQEKTLENRAAKWGKQTHRDTQIDQNQSKTESVWLVWTFGVVVFVAEVDYAISSEALFEICQKCMQPIKFVIDSVSHARQCKHTCKKN